MMDRVFICYSRKDSEFVDQLVADLKAAGVPIWRDLDDITNDIAANTSGWRKAIEQALDDCSHIVIVLSPNAVNSEEVNAEWNHFLKRKNANVMPVLYEECQIPYRLNVYQIYRLGNDNEKETFIA